MPNLKDIKSRIGSVENTQKITKAMKMVAAAKVKKAENSVKASRPFTEELLSLFKKMLSTVDEISKTGEKYEHGLDNYFELLTKREINTVGLVLVSSNKGLAGAYNANVVRATLKKIKEYKAEGKNVVLYIVGQKGAAAFKHSSDDLEIAKTYITIANEPSPAGARMVAEDLADDFISQKIDKIEIVTTRFNNMMSYEVQDWTVLPVKLEDITKRENETKDGHAKIDALMDFVPDTDSILKKLVPMFVTNSIYQSLLEASASELASRMTAMSAASNNAAEMIDSLTVNYNKARQGAITQELIEIVSGAQAQG